MNTSLELLAKIQDYLERRLTLQDLESWLVVRLHIYLVNPASEVARLANLVELSLVEFHDGIRGERSIRQRLARRIVSQKEL